MKKFLLSLAFVAMATVAVNAQNAAAPVQVNQVKKECCKDHKPGQKCDKPADQQCPDCKAKAEATAMKHDCKKGEGQKCDKAALKQGCKKGEGQKCDKPALKQGCKKGEGQKCDKPANQQCPDCKKEAKKN